jgi:putative ABC transport system permease protein
MGIRLALGARPSNVLWLIARQAMIPVFAGLFFGWVTAVVGVRTLSSVLYGVSPTDPLTFACVVFLLLTVALAACVVPARRVTMIDPRSVLTNG